MPIVQAMLASYSTVQVAQMVEIDKQTLLRWLWAGKVAEPRLYEGGGVKLRVWTDRDVERIRKYKRTHYRKGRGRSKKREL